MSASKLRNRTSGVASEQLANNSDSHRTATLTSNESPDANSQQLKKQSDTTDEPGVAISRSKQQALKKWLHDADRIRDEFVSHFDSQVGDILRDFVYNIVFDNDTKHGGGPLHADLARLRSFESTKKEKRDEHSREKKQDHDAKNSHLHQKQFEMRASVLTEMLQISHIRTVANMFTAVLIIFALNTLLQDLLEKDSVSAILDVDFFFSAFGRFSDVIILWLEMLAATIMCVYPGFHFWHSRRLRDLRTSTSTPITVDYGFIAAYVLYQLAFLVLPLLKLVQLELPPASAFIIAVEQVRLMMKAHAFVRECAGNSLQTYADIIKNSDQHPRRHSVSSVDEDEEDDASVHNRGQGPHFSHFLYFLFAPTLVYRDAYPRTRTVRWKVVVNYAVQLAGCVLFMHFIVARFCVPTFRTFQPEHVRPKQMLIWLFSSMIPGSLVLFLGFYLLLHVWLNMFAEMLRFGDRLFYSDWWNSRTWARYYRTWNIVVHDWLYSYIYRDVCILLGSKGKVSRAASMSIVFFVSAVFHEYVIAIALGFFYPVLFCSFMGAGFGFIFLTEKGSSPWWNIFMWFCLFVGTGVNLCLLCIEWYARKNCQPIAGHPSLDFFIPRSWHCVSIDHSFNAQ